MAVNFTTDTLQKHKPLANAIKEGLVVEGNTIKEAESHATYFGNLPEGIERDTVESIAKYNNDYVGASHVAIGELAAGIFNEDKDAQKVEASMGFFGKKDKLTTTVHRTKTYRNNFAEKEEDKELKKHLVMQTSIQTSGHGLKSIRESMSEEFKNSFAK